jgi:hypothetical protein
VLSVTPAAIRRLAIRNQRLAGPAPRGQATAEDLLDTARALRCLQLDPTAVVARNHLLVLFSRHGGFDEARFEQVAYERRDLFEYWAHEASYVLSEDLPIHRYAMKPPAAAPGGPGRTSGGTPRPTSAPISSGGSRKRVRCARETSRTGRRSAGSQAAGRTPATSPACST